MLRHVVRLAAAALVAAAAGVVVPQAAQAATCSSASGVSVVVDFHQLGGGAQTFCDANGAGENAAQQLTDAGHTLTYVQGEAFVCQVDGKPQSQCQRTPPADAYWSLWWSDGKSGQWTYSSAGVTSLKVPDGGYVALSWQGQSSQAKPRVAPTAHGSSPSSSPSTRPTSRPTSKPSSRPSTGTHPTATASAPAAGGSSSAPGSSAASPSASGKDGHSHRRSRHTAAAKPHHHGGGPSATPEAGGTSGSLVSATTGSGGSSGGLPGWVAPVAVLVLFAGTGAVLLGRRRRAGGP